MHLVQKIGIIGAPHKTSILKMLIATKFNIVFAHILRILLAIAIDTYLLTKQNKSLWAFFETSEL